VESWADVEVEFGRREMGLYVVRFRDDGWEKIGMHSTTQPMTFISKMYHYLKLEKCHGFMDEVSGVK
jgi:hypothetical protein